MRVIILAFAAVAVVGGCSHEDPPLRLRRLQIRAVDADQPCGNAASEATVDLPARTYTLRLSFLRGSGNNASELTLGRFDLICDGVIEPGDTAHELLLPQVELARGGLVLRVEAFDPDEKRLAFSGQTRIDDRESDELTVYLQRAGAQSCFYGQRRPRAFHTATLLPNGQVLLTGGLSGSPNGSTAIDRLLFAEDTVEVFDPTRLSVALTVAKTGMRHRAFHRAVLLASPRTGPYRVLLLGGFSSASTSEPVAHLLGDLAADPFVVTPEANAVAAASAILTYYPALPGQDARVDYTELPAPPAGYFPDLALSGDGATLLVVGGATAFSPPTSSPPGGFSTVSEPQAQWWSLPTPTSPSDSLPELTATVKLARLRAGHSTARLPDGSFSVLGGVMDATDEAAAASLVELASAPQPFSAAPLAGAGWGTAWQSLTEIGLTDEERQQGKGPRALLWTGGLALDSRPDATPQWRAARTPRAGVLELLRSVNGKIESTGPLDPQGGLVPAGYHSAVRLHDGSVLISGGNHTSSNCQRPNGETTDTRFCPLAQLASYKLAENDTRLTRERLGAVSSLRLPRYGHQATRLLDLSVLFTGGLTINADGQPAVSGEAEILNVRQGGASEDYLFNLPAGRPNAEAALPCRLLGGP